MKRFVALLMLAALMVFGGVVMVNYSKSATPK